MAGESPGRAEQQESSGETTGKDAAGRSGGGRGNGRESGGKVTGPGDAPRGVAEPALAVAGAGAPAPHRAADDGAAPEDERPPAPGSRPAGVASAAVALAGAEPVGGPEDGPGDGASAGGAEHGADACGEPEDTAADTPAEAPGTEGPEGADAEAEDAEDAEDASVPDADEADADGEDADASDAGADEADTEAEGAEDAEGASDADAEDASDADAEDADEAAGADTDAEGSSADPADPGSAPDAAQDAPQGARGAAEHPGAPAGPEGAENAADAPARPRGGPGAGPEPVCAPAAGPTAEREVPPADRDREAPPVQAVAAPAPTAAVPAVAATALMPSVPPPPPPSAPPAGAVPPEADQEPGAGRPRPRESTRQQPLPTAPEEPLKLLAALTNTPPPPQTLLRTSLRRVKIWTPLVLLLAVVYCVVQALRPLPAPSLAMSVPTPYHFTGTAPAVPWPSEGQAALEVEGLGSMGTYGEQKPEPIASVAKIMTAYIVLHDHPMKQGSTGPVLTVDQQAAADYQLGADGESVVKVTTGQKISQFEALEDIMIASANNIARMLSRWDVGSEAAFVKKMNATAKSLGMDHTTYTDPSGLTATTVSTASDQLKLVERAMNDPVFRQVVAEPEYRTASGDTYGNWNHLVGTNDVVGVKTGTSTAAGGNLVFAAYQDVGGTTQLILGVVLGQYKPSILDSVTAASLKLVLSAQHALTSVQVIQKGSVVGHVDDGFGASTPVIATQTVTAVGWPGVRVPIALKADALPHAAKAGTRVGTLTVGDGPGQIRVPVALQRDVTAPGLGDKLTRLG